MKLYIEVKILGEGKELKRLEGKTNKNIIRISITLNENTLLNRYS